MPRKKTISNLNIALSILCHETKYKKKKKKKNGLEYYLYLFNIGLR